MLIDKTSKVEKEVSDLLSEVVLLLQKAKAGETPVQILGEELSKLGALFADAAAVPGDLNESLDGVLRAVGLHSADLVCLLLAKPVLA